MVLQLSPRPMMRTSQRLAEPTFAHGADVTFETGEPRPIAMPNVLAICKRRWRLIGVCCGVWLVVAGGYILLATPLFTSTASILIDTRMNQTLQSQNIVTDTPVDTSGVDSQANVLSSDSIAVDVINRFDLTHDPEFVGPPAALGAAILYQVAQWASALSAEVGLKTPDADPGTLLLREAITTFDKRLEVKREQLSYVIDVSYQSESATKAAQIVNAVLDAYMAADLSAKIRSTTSANQWLQDRLLELKSKATDADHALQDYKAANNILETGRGLLDQQTLSDLGTQMITARAATAEAKARLDRLKDIIGRGIPDATVTDALNNNVITRLRAQYLDTAARKNDLVRTIGETHIAVQKLQHQMDDLAKSILGEEQRIADAYASDYEIALARQQSLSASMAQGVDQSTATNQAQVKARDLESSADAYRNIYNSFLQKFQETQQAQTIPVSDSRVVGVGQVPLKKSSPKTLLALVGGVLLGLMSGAGLAIAGELASNVYRSAADIEQDTGVRCLGILPDLARAGPNGRKDGSDLTAAKINEWILYAPYSRFAETIRNVYISLSGTPFKDGSKVIGVVSAVPKEGKSTVAANLGALCASLGRRTLLIDGDLHERALSRALVPAPAHGLLEALADPGRLADLVHTHPGSGLHVLPCVVDERPSNAADVLSSAAMDHLLERARDSYDFIIVELAPILAVVDVKAVGHLVDTFVLVVKWGDSTKRVVGEALADIDDVLARTAGVVLNKAHPAQLRSLESYKGSLFSHYYREKPLGVISAAKS